CTGVGAWLWVGTQHVLLQLLGTDIHSRETDYEQARKPEQRCLPQVRRGSGLTTPAEMDDLESEFNLKVVLVSFKQCLNEKEEVLLDHYLASWRGLRLPPSRRFLNSLGTIFSFISKDVVAKLQIMEQLCGGPQREHYGTLQAMVAYEVGSQLVDLERRSRHPDSGCRTVLRLHRALHWLQLFLEGVFLETMNVGSPEQAVEMLGEALPFIER
ncbi:hypothetical protein E2I00_015808, partial [Balaenoptera physalus]